MWILRFIQASYRHIKPKGFKAHVDFILDLPLIAITYRAVMNEYEKGLTK